MQTLTQLPPRYIRTFFAEAKQRKHNVITCVLYWDEASKSMKETTGVNLVSIAEAKIMLPVLQRMLDDLKDKIENESPAQ